MRSKHHSLRQLCHRVCALHQSRYIRDIWQMSASIRLSCVSGSFPLSHQECYRSHVKIPGVGNGKPAASELLQPESTSATGLRYLCHQVFAESGKTFSGQGSLKVRE